MSSIVKTINTSQGKLIANNIVSNYFKININKKTRVAKYVLARSFYYKILKDTKKAILVESIGDMLSLWEAGIKNVIVTFGLDVSVAILNTLLRIDPDKIYISLNNDASNNNAGNEAAKKVERKLLKYFNRDQIAIKLPDLNDFGDMSTVQIGKWAEDL